MAILSQKFGHRTQFLVPVCGATMKGFGNISIYQQFTQTVEYNLNGTATKFQIL